MNLIAKNFNRILALLAAVLLLSIFFSGAVSGVAGIFFFVLALVFLVVGFVSPCALGKSCDSGTCVTNE